MSQVCTRISTIVLGLILAVLPPATHYIVTSLLHEQPAKVSAVIAGYSVLYVVLWEITSLACGHLIFNDPVRQKTNILRLSLWALGLLCMPFVSYEYVLLLSTHIEFSERVLDGVLLATVTVAGPVIIAYMCLRRRFVIEDTGRENLSANVAGTEILLAEAAHTPLSVP